MMIDDLSVEVTLHGMKSNLMKDFLGKFIDLAHTDSNVIIAGEQGTGKQWFAKLIHKLEGDSTTQFYHLSCEQFKSSDFNRFFAQVKKDVKDFFVSNKKCNILIDNFSELNSEAQIQLLESILKMQEDSRAYSLDSDQKQRFIFTMNNHWHHGDTKNYVWTYLFNLLNPISVLIPPLRERREDIYPYAKLFLSQNYTRQYQDFGTTRHLEISDRALYKCISYNWPGNVRQLKNAITHAYFSTKDNVIQPEDLPISIHISSCYYSGLSSTNKSWSYINAEKQLLRKNSSQDNGDGFDLSFKSIFKKIITTKH